MCGLKQTLDNLESQDSHGNLYKNKQLKYNYDENNLY